MGCPQKRVLRRQVCLLYMKSKSDLVHDTITIGLLKINHQCLVLSIKPYFRIYSMVLSPLARIYPIVG